MAFKDIEARRKYVREYNQKLRKSDPEKARAKRRPGYFKELYAKDPSKQKTSSQKWREANPDKVREADRRGVCRKFGLTIQQYDSMLESQNHVCAICLKAEPSGKKLAIDHCHSSGVVRGLLCGKCNKSLGGFGDDPEILRSALGYLLRKSTPLVSRFSIVVILYGDVAY
jgi:hypothetical protein